jgi:AcrR family transcriptional regulator
VTESGRARRRRRTPQEAEAEIVSAAEALLRERPFRDLTVDEVMRRTELSRPSFYVYFRDRHNLVLRVVEVIGAELMDLADRWFKGDGDGPTQICEALEGVVAAFERYGPVLKALSDAAKEDERVEEVYTGLQQAFIDAMAAHIEREQATGRALSGDPREIAMALVWMEEEYMLHHLGIPGQTTLPPEKIVDVLSTILSRVIYGPASPAN